MTRSTALRRGLVAALAAVAATAGPLPLSAHASAAAAVPAEVTIPAGQKAGSFGYPVTVSDANGYLIRSSSAAGLGVHYAWYANDGSLRYDLGDVTDPLGPQATRLADGSTLLWARVPSSESIRVYDTAAGAWTTYTLPQDRRPVRILPTSSGWTIAAVSPVPSSASGAQMLHLMDPTAGATFTDRPVNGWPASGAWSFGAWRTAPGAAVMQYGTPDGSNSAGLLNTDTASMIVSGPEDNAPLINHDLFGWGVDGGVDLRPRSDPQAAPRRISLPGAAGQGRLLVLTDSALIVEAYNGDISQGTIYSVPLDGGPASILVQDAGVLSSTADGGALATGADATGAEVTYKIPAAGGAPTVQYRFPTYQPENIGLSLARGALVRAETGPSTSITAYVSGAGMGVGATPKLGSAIQDVGEADNEIPRCDGDLRCLALTDTDDTSGPVPAYVTHTETGDDHVVGPLTTVAIAGSHGGRIVSASADRVLFDGSNGQQYVIDMTYASKILSTRPAAAAALWGNTLWSATATPGRFTVADAQGGSVTKTVTTDASCVPDEVQALGRWLYWSCGDAGPAGVWDSVAGKSVRVPAGHALLGDGYVLRHSGDQLVLTDVHSGTAAPDRVVAALPAGSYSDDRNITWTLDKFGDFLAYTDPQGTTHVLPSGVAPTPVGILSSAVSPLAGVSATGWQPQWTLTRPAASWRVDLRRKNSTTVVKSFTGGAASRSVNLTWDGRNGKELLTPDGDYTWTLALTPADGQGGTTTVTGTVTLSGGAEAPRDYTGDDVGDLLALTSGGGIDVRPGTGTGTGSVGATALKATGWPSGSTIVPIDDLSGDKVNDLLVRDASGHLTRYDGIKGQPPGPALPHHLIGAGWNIYNVLTSPGDTNNDGYPDLVARDSKGDLYLYKGTASGIFAPREKIGYGYQIYDTIVGVHGLQADFQKVGCLLARDAAGVLWEYQSDGFGRLNGRVRVGAGWNVYNSLVGVGDLNGDGFNDLIARDKNGDLWRYNGLGNRWFAPRVKIGWGWQMYKALL